MADGDAGLRRRKKLNAENLSSGKEPKNAANEIDKKTEKTLETNTFWLTRIVLLRYIGFIYFVAFLVALHQNKELCGQHGLIPAQKFLKRIQTESKGSTLELFTRIPSLVWLIDYENSLDRFLDYTAWAGLALSLFVIVVGGANWFIMLALWTLYHSIVNVGSTWYGFGWESQILETGFLATFLCPVWNLRPVPEDTPTSKIVIWGFRWLIFRIMIGAGLIKLRGDQCWRDLTCMNYHYETQPVPNPISYFMHQSPEIFHKFETLTNHFVELVVPWFLIGPRRLCMIGGTIQILFQVVLIISGNLSFLNWLTIVPSLACFDDASLRWMFSGRAGSVKDRVYRLQGRANQQLKVGSYIRRVFNISLGGLIAYLSIPVVQNLLSPRQAMNTSFDPLRIVNTYGAFGSVTKERTEVIFQGTYDNPHEPSARWEEYEFKCKPGNVTRRPCLISPYHYRLDWLLWFAAFQNYQYNPWLVHLAVKLMSNDPGAESLISHNPFHDRDPPKYIRVEHYRYIFTKIGSKDARLGRWWKRSHVGNYLPPISLDSVKAFMKNMDYEYPRIRRRKKH
ncbi:lipase maturation factor 1-like [Crassostrea angulata]|uniref:lipase maturation factor 1-like n=1 Tax=Magallana angulata TaxID=2784310 RepID=UPI0022B1AB82|nr:lipase maturation factor 1-like [Crassostrea angulata]